MPHRDPETGQFVAGHGLTPADFSDTEVANFMVNVDIPSAETTTTQGRVTDEANGLYDLDAILDRDEEGVMLTASHVLRLQYTDLDATAPTEVGGVQVYAEVSTSSVLQVDPVITTGDAASSTTRSSFDDSLDLIGRGLMLTSSQVFRDAVDAVGGGADLGGDDWQGMPADPHFFARDEVLANFELIVDNVDDPGISAVLAGQHIYGVREA